MASGHIPHPEQDDPISMPALTLLKQLAGKITHIQHTTMRSAAYQELFIKLMIEYGSCFDVVYWAATQTQQRLNPIERIMVRTTERGRKLLLDMATKENSTIQ